MKILCSRRISRRRRGNKAEFPTGFTLIEMTIVLFIILSFLAMSVPFFSNFSGSTGLRTAEREVATILGSARSYAISHNENYEVIFDTNTTPHTYSIRRSAAPAAPIGKTYQLPSGVTFAAAATIRFTTNGGLAGDTPDDRVTVSSSKGNRLIRVETATGAVTM